MNWIQTDEVQSTIDLTDIHQLNTDSFPIDSPVRFNIRTPDVVLPLLVINRCHHKLTVLNNGAVDLKKSKGLPVFQRSSWWRDVSSNQIYVCDPRTVGCDALSIPWIQSRPPTWFGPDIVRAVTSISRLLNVDAATDRTYFGSSAGGYAALIQLGSDRHASAVVNNAQFDWTKWFPAQVNAVLDKYFSGLTAADVRRRSPRRTNALKYLSANKKPLRIDYWVNMASKMDREIQLDIFQKFFTKHPELIDSVTVRQYYYEKSGHNPLPRKQIVNILNGSKLEN